MWPRESRWFSFLCLNERVIFLYVGSFFYWESARPPRAPRTSCCCCCCSYSAAPFAAIALGLAGKGASLKRQRDERPAERARGTRAPLDFAAAVFRRRLRAQVFLSVGWGGRLLARTKPARTKPARTKPARWGCPGPRTKPARPRPQRKGRPTRRAAPRFFRVELHGRA